MNLGPTFSQLRIGQGLDVHAFVAGRKLILAGCEIPHVLGLQGHSDADVVLHALTDAILGALAWGDIGQHFPDTDPAYKDIDSQILLEKIWHKAEGEGWHLINCDLTILAQVPKLSAYYLAMRENIARLFGASLEQVSLKATTTEHLGFVGRKEGILCSAVLLLGR